MEADCLLEKRERIKIPLQSQNEAVHLNNALEFSDALNCLSFQMLRLGQNW